MNQVDTVLYKDMNDSDLFDVESIDLSDNQTWLFKLPTDSGRNVDILDWRLSFEWPFKEDQDYHQAETQLYSKLDAILKDEILLMADKHKFDSRTYVRSKKRPSRPHIQSILETSPNSSLNQKDNKYLTYNKYNMPLGQVSPMIRLKTFNLDTHTENSGFAKDFAMKRRSFVGEEEPQLELEDIDVTLVSETSNRASIDSQPSKPINIDLSQPAHNLHNTFNKGLPNIVNERGSLNMYQSGEFLMRMSPPSLVSSLLMESSGNFNPESMDGKVSLQSNQGSIRDSMRMNRESLQAMRDSGVLPAGRDSVDPMLLSMTTSILDEKDMSTSFLSQTTYPDNESVLDSLPPSLVSSVNSSFIQSNHSKTKPDPETNIFSSTTFTHLDQSEKLLTARPRIQMFNTITKRDSMLKNSESYTKSREEGCQIDTTKVLNENAENKEIPKQMTDTVTLHYSNKFRRNAEKENLNATFEADDAFFKDMAQLESGKTSLNVTLDKQELNEIIQARKKLSLARQALPTDKNSNIETVDTKIIQLPNQVITIPKQSMENASELLSRRRQNTEKESLRDTPKRNATFKKSSPKSSMDATVVFMKSKEDNRCIDINSATLNLVDCEDRTLQPKEEWGLQEQAMVGSSESTDTGTFSSSSPPESVPHHTGFSEINQVASTPLAKRACHNDMLALHNTISPIYDVNDKSYTLAKAPSTNTTYESNNTTVINSATIVRKPIKRDILTGKESNDTVILSQKSLSVIASSGLIAPPSGLARKTNLPQSKLRQFSSHRELSRIPGGSQSGLGRTTPGKSSTMVRRGVYASNPVLSPTAPSPPLAPQRRDSYTIATDAQQAEEKTKVPAPPALVRQRTETLRRERPMSQLVAPKDLRISGVSSGVPMRHHQIPPPTTRPYSIASTNQLRNHSRPSSGPVQRSNPVVATVEQTRPASSTERVSALPRPSRLPAPRRTLRPPSVYSVAPTADVDHY